MSILSSTLWPSDMPDERRVIALLGLVQISEDGMEECKCTMSKRLTGDGCRYCQPQEYIDNLGEWLEEERIEVERLNAIVAMQAKALTEIASFTQSTNLYWWQKEARNALSATSETVSAWLRAKGE